MTHAPAQINAHQIALFLDLLHRLQKVDAEFPIQYAICLMHIYQNEGCTISSLAEQAGLALSTVSRIVGALSTTRQYGEAFGFIEVHQSKSDSRKKEIFLTDKGRATIQGFVAPLATVL